MKYKTKYFNWFQIKNVKDGSSSTTCLKDFKESFDKFLNQLNRILFKRGKGHFTSF